MAASMVGRPLSCDESTYNCIRLDYARVCVEVDASLAYVHEFEIESPLTFEPITVKVDYEWKPPINKGKSPVNDAIPMPVPAFPLYSHPQILQRVLSLHHQMIYPFPALLIRLPLKTKLLTPLPHHCPLPLQTI